jgi:hypothetical protein
MELNPVIMFRLLLTIIKPKEHRLDLEKENLSLIGCKEI